MDILYICPTCKAQSMWEGWHPDVPLTVLRMNCHCEKIVTVIAYISSAHCK